MPREPLTYYRLYGKICRANRKCCYCSRLFKLPSPSFQCRSSQLRPIAIYLFHSTHRIQSGVSTHTTHTTHTTTIMTESSGCTNRNLTSRPGLRLNDCSAAKPYRNDLKSSGPLSQSLRNHSGTADRKPYHTHGSGSFGHAYSECNPPEVSPSPEIVERQIAQPQGLLTEIGVALICGSLPLLRTLLKYLSVHQSTHVEALEIQYPIT